MADDICRICGKEGPLSFEHIPPQSVGNDHTVKLYSGVDAVKSSLTGQDDMEGLRSIGNCKEVKDSRRFAAHAIVILVKTTSSHSVSSIVQLDSKSLSLTFRKGIDPFISRQIGSCLLHL